MTNPGDRPMLREAATIALADADLCTCPMQVFKLARELAQFVPLLDECLCPMCVGIQAQRFEEFLIQRPELLDGFHRPGASALHGPGEERDDLLIGPNC